MDESGFDWRTRTPFQWLGLAAAILAAVIGLSIVALLAFSQDVRDSLGSRAWLRCATAQPVASDPAKVVLEYDAGLFPYGSDSRRTAPVKRSVTDPPIEDGWVGYVAVGWDGVPIHVESQAECL